MVWMSLVRKQESGNILEASQLIRKEIASQLFEHCELDSS